MSEKRAVLECGHERVVSEAEALGNPVGCSDCDYKWRRIVAFLLGENR